MLNHLNDSLLRSEVNLLLSYNDRLSDQRLQYGLFYLYSPCMLIIKAVPYHAEFLKWNSSSYIFGTFHYHF